MLGKQNAWGGNTVPSDLESGQKITFGEGRGINGFQAKIEAKSNIDARWCKKYCISSQFIIMLGFDKNVYSWLQNGSTYIY
jgi:hypothetical protein